MSLSEFLSIETFECEAQSDPSGVLSHLLFHNDGTGSKPFFFRESESLSSDAPCKII